MMLCDRVGQRHGMLTVVAVAARFGVTGVHVGRIRRGVRWPS